MTDEQTELKVYQNPDEIKWLEEELRRNATWQSIRAGLEKLIPDDAKGLQAHDGQRLIVAYDIDPDSEDVYQNSINWRMTWEENRDIGHGFTIDYANRHINLDWLAVHIFAVWQRMTT